MITNNNWIIFNGQTGEVYPVEKFPFEIGTGVGADLKLQDPDLFAVHCSVENGASNGISLQCAAGVSGITVNGQLIQSKSLQSDTDYLILLGGHTLALRGGVGVEEWLTGLDSDRWSVFDSASEQYYGPFPMPAIIENAKEGAFKLDWVVHLDGMGTGARIHQMLDAMKVSVKQALPPPPENSDEQVSGHRTVDPDKGDLTCPVCWLQFDTEDIMHVATHPDLYGDSVLGEDAATRFHTTRFDEHNRALDPKGSPCIEMACPHCRHVLPPEFMDSPARIISIVADSGGGKSYFLAVLSKLLPEILFREMNVVFQDANPMGNAKLSDLRTALFSAREPSEAILARTVMEGEMYARCTRYDREVQMPYPFIYSLSKDGKPERSLVVFYDNSGEHFQAHIDINLQPGAQHVSSAAGIIFLFDPFCSAEFRSMMMESDNPETGEDQSDRHDVILAEMKVRVQKLRNLPSAEKVSTPLAVVVGKSDMWIHALPKPVRTDLISDGQLNLPALTENSALLRAFLMGNAPKVVGNAESFSSNVQYFAASSFGHVPPVVQSADGFKSAPDPTKLKPFQVDAPPLWILSQVTPELVPTKI
ncbi:MAG: hypothetical protein CMI32_01680 [Opitutales bacterium]|nr:hypothetical protein [Opitutales bacterium]